MSSPKNDGSWNITLRGFVPGGLHFGSCQSAEQLTDNALARERREHERTLERERAANAEAIAQRDIQIEKLEARIKRYETALETIERLHEDDPSVEFIIQAAY